MKRSVLSLVLVGMLVTLAACSSGTNTLVNESVGSTIRSSGPDGTTKSNGGPGTTRRSTATTRGSTTGGPGTTRSSPSTSDDPGAAKGLIEVSDLPAGSWKVVARSSGDNTAMLLETPECAAILGGVDPTKDRRRAKRSFEQGEQLESQSVEQIVEVYPSPDVPAAYVAFLKDPGLGSCYQAYLTKQSDSDSSTKLVGDVKVSNYSTGQTAADLDIDAIAGATLSFTLDTKGQTVDVEVRLTVLQKGNADTNFAAVTVAAPGGIPAVVDLEPAIAAAAAKLGEVT